MPYIGKTPLTGAYQLCDTITTSATATYNLTVGGSAVIPGAAQNCIVSLNGVVQAPVSAYTVSGSTIVFASTLSATDVIDFILILGNVFDIGKPTDGSVTNASVSASAAIAYSKLNLGTSIVNADISTTAAIATTKLGAGAVLQVITATDSTSRSTTSTSYVTGSNTLSVTITPSSTSNKIFIQVSSSGYRNTSNSAYYTIFRGATNLASSSGKLTFFNVNDKYMPISMSFLDSPNTTSATTYQVYFKMAGASPEAYLNPSDDAEPVTGTITAFEIKG
jgi:hypothetical protein